MSGPGPLPQAVAVVLFHGGKTLLIRRAEGRPAAGYWGPLTGRIEEGEGPEDAARREAQEEVGLAVRVRGEVYRCETVGARFELRWFEAEVEGTPALRLAEEEVAEARWCTFEEASRLEPMFDVTRAFYRRRSGP